MERYNIYIMRMLAHSMLLITISLTSIVWLTQALRFIDVIVNQGVSIWIFLMLTLLLIPSLLVMILPPAMLCSVLFVYNKLKMDSELVVLQAAGLSKWALARPTLIVACGATLLGYAITFYLQPVTYREFKEMQFFLRNNYASILLQEGVFSSPVSGLTVFIRERDDDNILRGILVHDNRTADKSVTMMAEEGRLVQTPQGPRFLMVKGNRQEVQNGKLSFLNFENYTLDISLYTGASSNRYRDPQEMFVHELFAVNEAASPQELMKRRAEGHQRIVWPAYSLGVALVGLAVLLASEFNRRGHWRPVTLAVVFAVVMLFGAVGLRGLIANQPHMVWVYYLAFALPSAIAVASLNDKLARQRWSKA